MLSLLSLCLFCLFPFVITASHTPLNEQLHEGRDVGRREIPTHLPTFISPPPRKTVDHATHNHDGGTVRLMLDTAASPTPSKTRNLPNAMGPHPTDGSQDDENASNVTGKEVDSSKIIPPNSSPQVGDGASPTAAGGREQTNNGMGRDGGVYGVAVGITVVVLILIALGIWWLVWWKKQKREKEEMRIEMMRQEQAS